MKITDFSAVCFRNLESVAFQPDSGINVIFGENGQGKTNIIEGIWLFTGCHSFRTHKHAELIEKGKREAKVSLSFVAQKMENDAVLQIGQKREFILNGAAPEPPRKFLGEFQAVVFSPASLFIIQDAPSERRKFLDIAISMVKPAYAVHLMKYSKILANRNALLKQIPMGVPENYLDAWDEELARVGARITQYRLSYTDDLARIGSEIYKEISGGREKMQIEYKQSSKSFAVDEYALTENIFLALQKNRETDIRRQMTGVGPHKDDLEIRVSDLSARFYGSQGQQRSCALAMKLAEAYIVKEISGEYPVILLDDVMSELDTKRQTYLLEYLKNWQVFLTCCDLSHFSKLQKCKTFHVENGRVREE